ncbi:hypothetical protein BDZ97DRAFT_1901288 [Flammula alnicola]|nr:hypothetical protein BDZ97DRAFT_1901288 [Flammula alnicola]
MYGSYGTTSPPLTNNPFIASTDHPSTRFPDLSTPPQQQQQQYGTSGNGSMTGGYPQQQQQGVYQQQSYPPQQQQMVGMSVATGYYSPGPQSYSSQASPGPFQPSSSFGQQLAAGHVSGSSYGYLQGQQQPQQNPNAYNPAQQQLQNNPGYIAQFDPYSSIGQAWGDANASGGGGGMAQSLSTGSTASSISGTSASSSYGVSASGDPHPRDYIRTHKVEVEAWDQYAWKQLLGAFEALMRAWEGRKLELARRVGELSQQMAAGMAYGPYYVAQIQQEGSRVQGLLKEAEDNFGMSALHSVAASTFQMKEVFQGYRHSSDLLGKRRVKEATNAALQGLPGWPQPY